MTLPVKTRLSKPNSVFGHKAVSGRCGNIFAYRFPSFNDFIKHIFIHDLDCNDAEGKER